LSLENIIVLHRFRDMSTFCMRNYGYVTLTNDLERYFECNQSGWAAHKTSDGCNVVSLAPYYYFSDIIHKMFVGMTFHGHQRSSETTWFGTYDFILLSSIVTIALSLSSFRDTTRSRYFYTSVHV